MLDCAIWGVADPRDAALARSAARGRGRGGAARGWRRSDAIDADGRPTAHGRAIAALPLPPRLGAHAGARGRDGAGAGRRRRSRCCSASAGWAATTPIWRRGCAAGAASAGQRAEAARRLARALGAARSPPARASGAEPRRSVRRPSPGPPAAEGSGIASRSPSPIASPGAATRRARPGHRSAGAGSGSIRPSPLARAEWLAVAETQGMAAGARILSAAPIDRATVEALFADRIETRRTVALRSRDRRRRRRCASGGSARSACRAAPTATPIPPTIAAALLEGVRDARPGAAALERRRATRCATAPPLPGIDALDRRRRCSPALDDWLPPLLAGKRRLDAIDAGALTDALRDLLGWDAHARDRPARARATSTTPGRVSSHAIDYAAEAGPTVELRAAGAVRPRRRIRRSASGACRWCSA